MIMPVAFSITGWEGHRGDELSQFRPADSCRHPSTPVHPGHLLVEDGANGENRELAPR